MDFPSWPFHISIAWQSDCNFNPLAISQWTRKCPGNVAGSSCELPDFNWKKYSNTSRYLGNGNRYPPGHEHGYQAGIEGCKFAPPNFQLKKFKRSTIRRAPSFVICIAIQRVIYLGHLMMHLRKYPKP